MPKIPAINSIHTAVYKAASVPNALDMDAWHNECGTTHCRAGHVVMLAGKAGLALEKATDTAFAAMQIYKKSGYLINPSDFYATNKQALNDMKELAEKEASEA